MISYIVSYENQKYVSRALEESGQTVMNALVTGDFNFSDFVKQQSDQLQMVTHLIIDMEAIKDDAEELKGAVSNFRMLYNAAIIMIASGHKAGDEILDYIFCAGIYDIVTSEREQMLTDITYCLKTGMTYKDSLKFKITKNDKTGQKISGNDTGRMIQEKIIIKNTIKKTASRQTIGFTGVQARIGVTHNAIVCAGYLRKKGFHVAVVESSENVSDSFNKIKHSYDVVDKGMFFTLDNLDFYPNYDLKNLPLIFSQNYNFTVIDFGIYGEGNKDEFMRCTIPIAVAGFKAWEADNINVLFESLAPDLVKEIYYLFNFTAEDIQPDIRENMKPFEKVYFQDYIPDPFSDNICSAATEKIFSEYLPEEVVYKNKENLMDRWKYFWRNDDRKEKKRNKTFTL